MKLHGRDAYVIENDVMRLSVLTGGGYIGEVRFVSPDPKKAINPLSVPHYATIDPQNYVPARHDPIYGDTGDKKIMAGYLGHFLCFPYIGGPNSSREREAGFSVHGEAAVVKWEIKPATTDDGAASMPARRSCRSLTMPSDGNSCFGPVSRLSASRKRSRTW